jgi:curved DNA-binding protein CbpA
MNPNDPEASARFAQLSESYSVLANPEKRKRYDRDRFRARQASHSATRAVGHTGSYAGSRPPSGLSKRRGAFRGPPPSFYTHGGSSAKNTSSASSSASRGPAPGGTFDASQYSSNPDPNFDSTSTFKTQSQEDIRRQSRRAAALAAAAEQMEDDSHFWARFFVVTGVILGAITIGTIVGGLGSPKGGMTRGDGSRRDGPSNTWTKG